MQSEVNCEIKQEKPKVKAEEKATTEFKCVSCAKSYPKQNDLDIHIKAKHDKVEKS